MQNTEYHTNVKYEMKFSSAFFLNVMAKGYIYWSPPLTIVMTTTFREMWFVKKSNILKSNYSWLSAWHITLPEPFTCNVLLVLAADMNSSRLSSWSLFVSDFSMMYSARSSGLMVAMETEIGCPFKLLNDCNIQKKNLDFNKKRKLHWDYLVQKAEPTVMLIIFWVLWNKPKYLGQNIMLFSCILSHYLVRKF